MKSKIPEISSGEEYKKKILEEVKRRDSQDEALRMQREEFCRLLKEECKFSLEEAEESYDVRRALMLLKSNYDWRGEISREEFLLTLDLGKEMLRHEGRRGFIPFLARRDRKHQSEGEQFFVVASQHPLLFCQDLCTAPFVVYDEDGAPIRKEVSVSEEEGQLCAEDMKKVLDFCITIHAVNTEYFRAHPRVGVMQTGELSQAHENQKTREANYLSLWRLLPFRVCQDLFESRAVDVLDVPQRDRFIEKIMQMCLEEMFDRDYFDKRIREKPVRGIDAEKLLRIIIGEYGNSAPVLTIHTEIQSSHEIRYAKTKEQYGYLSSLFGGPEELY